MNSLKCLCCVAYQEKNNQNSPSCTEAGKTTDM